MQTEQTGHRAHTPKLLIVPGYCHSLGGTLVTLSALIKGFEQNNAIDRLVVIVWKNSKAHEYLISMGQEACLQVIVANSLQQFLARALQWVKQQPLTDPLLLDNTVSKELLPILGLAALSLRLSRRPIYHFCHDLALSYNFVGFLLRKLVFTLLAPQAICNSSFTAHHIQRLMPKISGILYQPIDLGRFNNQPTSEPPPTALQPILQSGARVFLTPSRITKPGLVNDKNLRALIPVLAWLKAHGHHYHSVIVGEDNSPEKSFSHQLLEQAEQAGVADCFTILPPQFEIETYYKYADVVVTLAPREPFGRTVVEAIACGTPVIGSQTGGVGEILRNFASHWTVSPDNAEQVAKAILQTVQARDNSTTLQKGQAWINKYCSVLRYAQHLMEITRLTKHNHNIPQPSISIRIP